MGMHHLEELALKLMGSREKAGNSGCRNYGRGYHKAEERQSHFGHDSKDSRRGRIETSRSYCGWEKWQRWILCRKELSFSSGELQGLHIGVTGTEGFSGRLAATLGKAPV